MSASSAVRRDLARVLEAGALVAEEDHPAYERGYRYGAGRALAVARPGSVEGVRDVVRYCHRHDIPMVAQGANTGLTGASTPDDSGRQVVVSLERLAGIERLDVADRSASVMAGARLSRLNAEAQAFGLQFPIDLGADPTIGGMVATNTGGARLIRYGDVRRNLLGLEVVLADADASMVSMMRGLRKDNSGVDLKQVFVGTGGAFGIVVRARLELHPVPVQTMTAFVTPRDHGDIPAILTLLDQRLGDFLSACEGLSRNAIRAAVKAHPALRNPFADAIPPYVLLVELTTGAGSGSGVDLVGLFGEALAESLQGTERLIEDVVIARPAEAWALRHAVSDGLKALGRVIGIDVAVPRSRLPDFRREALAFMAAEHPYLTVCDFGHCGDGGDHFNIVWPPGAGPDDFVGVSARVRAGVYRIAVAQNGGTFSAEHGVGPVNRETYCAWTAPGERLAAKLLKSHFDPKGLLGNVDLT
ncbi:MAG: FAD-binding oxidoreductase [Phenylobacterium sp.]|uniref:FAD-binding oxidoreductase n=1 Tax=Phenylobacterium sp. TaxID=1871053 RepID=UPI00273669D7|nr:FAD-binding oxidoreductase [Phenylobacterium sp.]MDP3746567.1 FAD-binding oxidoreductase [Phenylobacterium sp.]